MFLCFAAWKASIVYAHWSLFNPAANDAAAERLTDKSCTVDVTDLYAKKFKATAAAVDISGIFFGYRRSKGKQTFLLCRGNLHNWYGRMGNGHHRTGFIQGGGSLVIFW